MALTDVQICNLALQRVGEAFITSLSEQTKEAVQLRAAYPVERDAMLREHLWNFATRRALITSDATAPAFGFTAQYTLPADLLRLVSVYGHPNDYRVEGQKLLLNEAIGTQIGVSYIASVPESEFRADFSLALALRVAAAIAKALGGTDSQRESLIRQYEGIALPRAKRVDGIENPPQAIQSTSWITVRG